ncbi:MAG: 4a-hydroxytetrahydrobiopterin dehydratase [Verrucomicrobia bacterium]|nr:4a-hydroxytetrahydrobiopterin dehydratase [Verrucomicrobiota bacterium]
MAKSDKLSQEEILEWIRVSPEWTLSHGKLTRHMEFKNFIAAFSFMTAIAIHAEKLNHHPEWSNVYNKVIIQLITHDAGGITQKDLELAKIINSMSVS